MIFQLVKGLEAFLEQKRLVKRAAPQSWERQSTRLSSEDLKVLEDQPRKLIPRSQRACWGRISTFIAVPSLGRQNHQELFIFFLLNSHPKRGSDFIGLEWDLGHLCFLKAPQGTLMCIQRLRITTLDHRVLSHTLFRVLYA